MGRRLRERVAQDFRQLRPAEWDVRLALVESKNALLQREERLVDLRALLTTLLVRAIERVSATLQHPLECLCL